MSKVTKDRIIIVTISVVITFLITILLSGCATLTPRDNDMLDKEKERIEEINPEELHPRPDKK